LKLCRFEIASGRWLEFLFLSLTLLLTAAISLIWSHFRLLDNDEFLVLWTDRVSTLGQLVQIQRTVPISLDPILYHALAHFALRTLCADAFAIRLPSLAGFLLMQVCLYAFVRQFADSLTAIFTMAFPAVTATLFYAVEGRPYGLLLGLYGLVLWSWQRAARKKSHLQVEVCVLALAVAMAINAHYFGILLLVPLCGAELYKTFEKRRVDWPVVAAVMAGMASMVFVLPFESAIAVFREHYYNTGAVGLHAITQAYRSLFWDYTSYTMRVQHWMALVFVVSTVVVVWGCVQELLRRKFPIAGAEVVFLVGLAGLPVFGFLLARYVTHSFEPRYVLGAMVGIAPLLGIALTPFFRRPILGRILLVGLLVGIANAGVARIDAERRATRQVMASLVVAPEIKAAVMSSQSQRLYVQDFGHFATAAYYEPDAELRSRLVLVYSKAEEIRWRGRDTNSLTALHMRVFTPYATVPYEGLVRGAGGHVFMLFHTGWDWTDEAFEAGGAVVKPLGRMVDGDVDMVGFDGVNGAEK